MKKSNYTITPFWDKKAVKDDGTSRIMITVNLPKQQFRVTIKLRSTKSEFEKALSAKGGSDEVKVLRRELNRHISKAESIFERVPNCTKDTFIKFFKSEVDLHLTDKTDVYFFLQSRHEDLLKQKRFGTAYNVKLAMSSLKKFRPKLYFEDIDNKFISGYRDFMLETGRSETTLGMYLRELRTMYNYLIREGVIAAKGNPFKGLPGGSSVKSQDVLYPEQLKALWDYQPITLREARGKAFFFFCYLGNGMNFKDAASLKYSNIKNDTIFFIRQKTKTTKRSGKIISVYLHSEMKKILKEWGTKPIKADSYIFPMFEGSRDEKHFHTTLMRYKRTSNRSLNKIGIKLGFDVRLTLGLARHSFATKQMLDGTPVKFISDALGHSSMVITEHYMKSLPLKNIKEMSDKLLSF